MSSCLVACVGSCCEQLRGSCHLVWCHGVRSCCVQLRGIVSSCLVAWCWQLLCAVALVVSSCLVAWCWQLLCAVARGCVICFFWWHGVSSCCKQLLGSCHLVAGLEFGRQAAWRPGTIGMVSPSLLAALCKQLLCLKVIARYL